MRTNYTLQLTLTNVDSAVLPQIEVGAHAVVWTKGGLPDIYIFTADSMCGDGRIARLPKVQLPELANNYQTAEAIVEAVDGATVLLNVKFYEDDTPPF